MPLPTSTFPDLKTERLFLRRFQQTDLEKVYEGLSHPEVIKYYGVNYSSLQDTQKQLEWFWENEHTHTGIWWAVCSPDNQIFYGACGLNNMSLEHRKAEIGFWLLPAHWGKGITPEVAQLVCAYGFRQLNLHRIEALVESENLASKMVLQKMKFTQEGTMVDCEVKNGRFISLDIFAKFAEK